MCVLPHGLWIAGVGAGLGVCWLDCLSTLLRASAVQQLALDTDLHSVWINAQVVEPMRNTARPNALCCLVWGAISEIELFCGYAMHHFGCNALNSAGDACILHVSHRSSYALFKSAQHLLVFD
jgi:hypothetical protein